MLHADARKPLDGIAGPVDRGLRIREFESGQWIVIRRVPSFLQFHRDRGKDLQIDVEPARRDDCGIPGGRLSLDDLPADLLEGSVRDASVDEGVARIVAVSNADELVGYGCQREMEKTVISGRNRTP